MYDGILGVCGRDNTLMIESLLCWVTNPRKEFNRK